MISEYWGAGAKPLPAIKFYKWSNKIKSIKMKKLFRIVSLLLVFSALFSSGSSALDLPSVAVFDFEADNVSEQTAFLASSFLRKELSSSGRMNILERNEMDKVLQAQGESLGECTEEGCAVKLGRILDAENIIIGKVSKTGARLIVLAKFIDLETGKIEFAHDITVDGISEDKLTDYIPSLAAKISAELTITGKLIEVGAEIITDLGEEIGVRSGDRFKVSRYGRELKDPDTQEVIEREIISVGELEVIRLIGKRACACRIAEGSGFQVGDFIEYKGVVRQGEETTPTPVSPSIPVSAGKSYGSVSISTDPSGASVYLDGDDYGETPVRRDDVETGEYTLALHKDGYVDAMQMLTISRGRTAEVDVKLVKQMGSLNITCSPPNAHIYFDGAYKGTAGAQGLKLDYLSVGNYNVKAEADSYYPEEKSVEVYYNQTTQVSFSLKPKPGAVFVMSTPGGAEVYLDNKKQSGKTPYKVNDVSTGSHRVKVYLGGYETAEKSVSVDAEKTATVSFDLVKVEVPTAPPTIGGGSISGDKVTGPLSGMTFVKIPGGSFQMGSNDGDSNEKPVHKVTIRPFYMMTTEVTQGMWKKVMGNNPSNFKGDNLPVERVSWNDCQAFLKKLNSKYPGKTYRLPTEAEWEYACRAGTTTKYYSGNRDSDLGRVGWYRGNAGSKTHPVGQKSPNSWGLYDMHGNVYEWCSDWYGDYPSGSMTDPQGPSSGKYRVLRGGSWSSGAYYCRSAIRYYSPPSSTYNIYGFRIVFSP